MKRIKRRWIILIIVIIFGGAFIIWQEKTKLKTGNILNSIPMIDTIIVKDGKTTEEILTLTDSEPTFSDMTEIYRLPYYDLKQSERKSLIKEEPLFEIEFLQNNNLQYTVNVYQVEDSISKVPKDVSNANITYSYTYSLEGNNTSYIFVTKKINQLLGVNEGLKELLNIIESNIND